MMLTDEELAELGAAVERFPGLRDTLLIQLGRDAIARERAMRQPLTAEICERLGMVKRATGYYVTECRTVRVDLPRGTIEGYVWGLSLIVGHLFAAAKLAGVELDWRKVGE